MNEKQSLQKILRLISDTIVNNFFVTKDQLKNYTAESNINVRLKHKYSNNEIIVSKRESLAKVYLGEEFGFNVNDQLEHYLYPIFILVSGTKDCCEIGQGLNSLLNNEDFSHINLPKLLDIRKDIQEWIVSDKGNIFNDPGFSWIKNLADSIDKTKMFYEDRGPYGALVY